MLEYLTGAEVAAEAKLVRAAFDGTIVLVEGRKDHIVYGRILSSKKCFLIQSHGRKNLVDALESLKSDGLEGYVGIADADFWHIDGGPPHIPNMLVTDFHDLEMLIIDSTALDAVLDEYASKRKLASFFVGSKIRTPRTWLLRQAEYLGRLRLAAYRTELPLKFEGIDFSRFVSRNTLELNRKKCYLAVLANTANSEISTDDIDAGLAALSKTLNLRQLCCGHDVINVLVIGLRKAWATHVKAIASTENVEKILRLSYSTAYFEQSKLYGQAIAWQLANPTYELFD